MAEINLALAVGARTRACGSGEPWQSRVRAVLVSVWCFQGLLDPSWTIISLVGLLQTLASASVSCCIVFMVFVGLWK